ncbi:MAG: hypothetical protein ACQESB_07055 [Elusimicrobiota bacterium]
MLANIKKLKELFLDWGIVLLAIGASFSQDFMHAGFALLFISFLVRLFKGEISFKKSGLEIPVALFLASGIVVSLFSGSAGESFLYFIERFWYVVFIFIAIYLFRERELKKFTLFAAWAGIGIAVYTVLQSLIGLNFNLEFNIGGIIKFSPPELREVFSIGQHPVYAGIGIIGRGTEFALQILMLMFFIYGAFRKQLGLFLAFAALVFTFVYQVWFALLAIPLYLFFSKKRPVHAALSAFFILTLLWLIPGFSFSLSGWESLIRFFRQSPWRVLTGTGFGLFRQAAGAASVPDSFYLRLLAEGGLIGLGSFVFFMLSYYKLYFTVPPSTKEIWRKNHYGCILAVTGVLLAGVFAPVIMHPVNAMLFWTLAGMGVKTKQGGWTRRLVSRYGNAAETK